MRSTREVCPPENSVEEPFWGSPSAIIPDLPPHAVAEVDSALAAKGCATPPATIPCAGRLLQRPVPPGCAAQSRPDSAAAAGPADRPPGQPARGAPPRRWGSCTG